MQYRWTFDDKTQTLRAPSGRCVTVREIARWIQDTAYGNHDLAGAWAGWKVRGRWLKGPKGLRITPENLKRGLAGRIDPPNTQRKDAPGLS